MSIIQSIILGAIQGITEFLPVSSSGHLILVRDVLGMATNNGLAFDIMLHLATLLAVLVAFRKIILELARDLIQIVRGRYRQVKKEDRNLILALLVGTIPAGVMGYLFESTIENTIREPRFVAGMLIIGSALLIAGERYAKHREDHVLPKTGWWIGWFQVLALLPGMSRSGATIAGGMILGVKRIQAAQFSFLLSIPIIAGSALKKGIDIATGSIALPLPEMTAGFLTSFLVGWIVIHYFMKYLKNHTLYAFAVYRLLLAVVVLFLLKT
ncbi:MAG: undecaprenyl-diphosphatase UppP [bacterium]|nr:undecaprenyl-diphosphatase UppP [bacterium]